MPKRNDARLALLLCGVAVACGPGAHAPRRPASSAAGARPGLDVIITAAPHAGPGVGHAMVVERRELELRAGEQELVIDGLGLVAGGVSLRALGDPDALRVLDARVELGDADPGRLVAGALGHEVVLYVGGGERRGKLVAVDGEWATLALPDGRTELVPIAEAAWGLAAAAPPGGLAGARLRTRLDARRAGRHLVEISYSLSGIGWHADHTVTLDGPEGGKARVDSWVTLSNRSGRALVGAAVTLIAEDTGPLIARTYPVDGALDVAAGADVRTSLAPPAIDVAAARVLLFDGTGGQLPMQAGNHDAAYGAYPVAATTVEELRFPAARALPAGRVLVYAPDASGATLLVADGALERTAAGAEARVTLGPGHSVAGQRRRTRVDWGDQVMIESFEIVVRNQSDVPRQVRIWEPMYRGPRFKVVEPTQEFTPAGDRAIEFAVTIPARKRAVVKYRVEYPY